MFAAELERELADVKQRIAGWCDVDRSDWSAADRSQVLLALLEVRERAEAAVVDAMGEWDGSQAWATDGSLTPTAWLRSSASMSEGDARRMVRAGRLVRRAPQFAKALAVGDVTVGHVDAVARVVTPAWADLFDDHAEVLLDAARNLTVDQTAEAARRWASHADDVNNRGEPQDLHHKRGVWFGRTGDLELGRLLGSPEELAALKAALDKMEPPDPKHTPGGARSLAQRRYDALVALAGLALTDKHGRIDPTHTVNVVIDAATLAGEFNPHGRSDVSYTGPGGAGSVLPARVQQLLCGSWISRVLIDTKGEVLDLGRRARLFSPAQQRAILIRDRGCCLTNCDRPPEWCDVHHLDPYGPPTHGPTNLDNGIGLCRPHHTLVHQGWKPWQDTDGNWYLEPP